MLDQDLEYCEGYLCEDAWGQPRSCTQPARRPAEFCPAGATVIKDHDFQLDRDKSSGAGGIVLLRRNRKLAISSWLELMARNHDSGRLRTTLRVAVMVLYAIGFERKWVHESRQGWSVYYYEDLGKTLPKIARELLGREMSRGDLEILKTIDFEPRRGRPHPVVEGRWVEAWIKFASRLKPSFIGPMLQRAWPLL